MYHIPLSFLGIGSIDNFIGTTTSFEYLNGSVLTLSVVSMHTEGGNQDNHAFPRDGSGGFVVVVVAGSAHDGCVFSYLVGLKRQKQGESKGQTQKRMCVNTL